MALGLLLQAPLAQAKRVALLIGNAAYDHERVLRNPVADAELLGRVLKDDLKFDVVQVERNLTLGRMDAVVKRFAQQAQRATTVVFYFSGHGVTAPEDRRSFLLPVDARTGAPDALALHFQALAVSDVRDALRKAGAHVTLMLLDACRDGPGGGKSGSKGLARVGGGEQFLVAYATEEGQIAEDGSGRNSPYAQALAQAWRQPLPILAQLDKVYDIVTAQVPGQRPTREGNLRTDAFLANPFAPVTPQNRDRVEDEAWALCRGGATRVPCDDYLSGWPQGRYVALARTRIRDVEAAAAAPSGSQTFTVDGVSFRMQAIPAGSFLMGSPTSEPGRDDDEGPQRRVTVGAFQLGQTEVTQALWRAVLGENPSRFKDCGGDCPVEMVSWDDAQRFIQRLNQLTGQRFRLPSEAEWEYAARAGCEAPFNVGGDCGSRIEADEANFDGRVTYNGSRKGEYRKRAIRVGSFEPNSWGLYDMHGNVWEWVQDCYGPYTQAPANGSAKEATGCEQRVVRGGRWVATPQVLRSAERDRLQLGFERNIGTGFRLARTVL